MLNTLGEFPACLAALYAGLLIGLAAGAGSLLLGWIRNKWAQAALDLLFWVAAGVFAGWSLIQINGGQLRAYLALGLILGGLLSWRFVVSPVKRLFQWMKKRWARPRPRAQKGC